MPRRKLDEALHNFTRAIELNEKYARAIANHGDTYKKMNWYEEALADLTRATEPDAKELTALLSLIACYRRAEETSAV
jgi:tetratricopeptide (TPR) repeat protein